MVRARDSPQCAICEFVMKEMESLLEDEKTEVGHLTYLRTSHLPAIKHRLVKGFHVQTEVDWNC